MMEKGVGFFVHRETFDLTFCQYHDLNTYLMSRLSMLVILAVDMIEYRDVVVSK